MKMKKIVCAMVSAALLVSMAAATAFAVESVPSKTGTDADAGKTDVSVSGSVSIYTFSVSASLLAISANTFPASFASYGQEPGRFGQIKITPSCGSNSPGI